MSSSFINSSDSPTTLPSLLLRTCHVPVSSISWVVKVLGPHQLLPLIGQSHMTMYCGCWIAFDRICNDSGFATTHNRVLTSEDNLCADLEICNIHVSQQTDLLVEVTLYHDFIGASRDGQTQGQLRNPDNPDHILESATADNIRNYRDTYRRNWHVAFLPACSLPRDASTASSFV